MRIWLSRLFFGLRVALGLGALAGAAWLFWPVGKSSTDWSQLAMHLAAEGDCVRARNTLSHAAAANFEGVEAFADSERFLGSCPASAEPSSYSVVRDDFADTYQQLENVRLASDASLFWSDARRIRAQERRGWLALPEFIIQQRCLYPLVSSPEARTHYLLYLVASAGFDAAPPAGVARRAGWCRSIMAAQIARHSRGNGDADTSALVPLYQRHLDYLETTFW